MMMREQHMKGDASVRGGARKGELNVRISYKIFISTLETEENRKAVENCHRKQEMCQFFEVTHVRRSQMCQLY